MKNNKAIVTFAIVLILIGVGNSLIRRSSHVCPLLSPVELQERLGVKPDGKIGPETMAAWDKALCDQYAAEAMEPFVGEDGYLDSPE